MKNKQQMKNKLVMAGSALASMFYSFTGKKGTMSNPNILFIMSDDHAYQAISAYGSVLNKTTNIDRLANEVAHDK